MSTTITCTCGASFTWEPKDPAYLSVWRQEHAECVEVWRDARRTGEPSALDVLGYPPLTEPPQQRTFGGSGEPELDRLVRERREKLGQVLDWDPYGPGEVPDAHRLDLLADWVERVNAAREVENRIPGDLRRMAADLRDAADPAFTEAPTKEELEHPGAPWLAFTRRHPEHMLFFRIDDPARPDDPVVAALQQVLDAGDESFGFGTHIEGLLCLVAATRVELDPT